MLGKKKDVIPSRKKNVSTRGKSLRVSIPNKGKQKKAAPDGPTPLRYCYNCTDLVKATSGYCCHADSNKVVKENEQKWLSPDTGFSLREHPSSRNRGNRCPDWTEKIG